MDFDLLVRSPNYLHFVVADQIPRSVVDEIAGQEMVESVSPFHTSMAMWDHPREEKSRGVVVIGINPDAPTFRAEETKVVAEIEKLTDPAFILIDQMSFPEFGPKNNLRFDKEDIGVSTQVQGKDIRISGLFEMGSGLTANGAVLINEQGFDRLLPYDAKNNVSMGLIKLKPGSSNREKKRIARELQNRFRTAGGHAQVEILTRDQVIRRELNRWLGETPIGFVFNLGVLISLIVAPRLFT